jgi:mono/diheme cytochrome c family protein
VTRRFSAATAFALVSLGALGTFIACAPAGSGESASRLFEQHCAGCHGGDGRGLPARRGLEPRLDLARSKMIAKGDRGLLFQRIAFGYGTMPGFAHKLSQGELEELVAFVQRFADTPTER